MKEAPLGGRRIDGRVSGDFWRPDLGNHYVLVEVNWERREGLHPDSAIVASMLRALRWRDVLSGIGSASKEVG